MLAGTISSLQIPQPLQVTIDANGSIDVDGHAELDNVNIAGVTTFNEDISFMEVQILTSYMIDLLILLNLIRE